MYYRVVGSTLAVPVRGHGSPGFPFFLLPETGHDVEACLRERERESREKSKNKSFLSLNRLKAVERCSDFTYLEKVRCDDNHRLHVSFVLRPPKLKSEQVMLASLNRYLEMIEQLLSQASPAHSVSSISTVSAIREPYLYAKSPVREKQPSLCLTSLLHFLPYPRYNLPRKITFAVFSAPLPSEKARSSQERVE